MNDALNEDLDPRLEDWLEIATRGLCPDARERIAEEIASHYEDALHGARGDGLAEHAAIASAVGLLGSPRRARRDLKREHLTKREGKALHRIIKRRNSRARVSENYSNEFVLPFMCFGSYILLLLGWSATYWSFLWDGAVLPILIMGFFLPFMLVHAGLWWWLGKRLGKKLHGDKGVPVWRAVELEGLSAFTNLVMVAMIFDMTYFGSSPENLTAGEWSAIQWTVGVGLSVCFVGGTIESVLKFRLARKLRRLGYDDPPSAMA